MFDGFALDRIDVGDVTLQVRRGGNGSPPVLLHGHPRTHATWCQVAPRLAQQHTVVCPDLRGYGQSTLPPDAPDHAQSSKRAMADDVVAVMRLLGHQRFAVVGHDRGAMVAYRLAMDYPDAVERLVVMDSVPLSKSSSGRTGALPETGGIGGFSVRPTSRLSGSSVPTRRPGTGSTARR